MITIHDHETAESRCGNYSALVGPSELAKCEAGRYVLRLHWDDSVDEIFDWDDPRRADGCPFEEPDLVATFRDRATGVSLLVFGDESVCMEAAGRDPRAWRTAEAFLSETCGCHPSSLPPGQPPRGAVRRLARFVGY